MLYYTILYYTILYYTTICYAMLCMLCYAIPSPTAHREAAARGASMRAGQTVFFGQASLEQTSLSLSISISLSIYIYVYIYLCIYIISLSLYLSIRICIYIHTCIYICMYRALIALMLISLAPTELFVQCKRLHKPALNCAHHPTHKTQ